MKEAWVLDESGSYVDVASSVHYVYGDPEMTVSGLPGTTTEVAVVVVDGDGHVAILDSDSLAGGCAVADAETPVGPAVPEDPDTAVNPDDSDDAAVPPTDDLTATPAVSLPSPGTSVTAGNGTAQLASTGSDLPIAMLSGAVLLLGVGGALVLRRSARARWSS